MAPIPLKRTTLTLLILLSLGLMACAPTKTTAPTTSDRQEGTTDSMAIVDCSGLGDSWIAFSTSATPLSFCYPKSWGVARFEANGVSPEFRVGSIHYISFSKSVSNNPLISFSTPDFRLTGDTDAPPFNWSQVDASKSDAELTTILSQFGKGSQLSRMSAQGHPVLKIHEDIVLMDQETIQALNYYIPQVTIGGKPYNFSILAAPEQEKDVDSLVGTILF